MSLLSLGSRLRRGREALERTVFALRREHSSPPCWCRPWRCWHRWPEMAAPSLPLPRDMSPPSEGGSLASDTSSSPLPNRRRPESLPAALLL